MTETPHSHDSEASLEALAERLEELEQQVETATDSLALEDSDGETISFGGLLDLGLTRRQAFAALGYVALGATSVGAIVNAVGNVRADTSNAVYGIEQLGTESEPITTIYVDNLYQNSDHIVTQSLSGDLVPRTPEITNLEGNVWHLEDGEALPSAAEPGDTIVRYTP